MVCVESLPVEGGLFGATSNVGKLYRKRVCDMKPDLEWRTNENLAAGKGATAQEFVAKVGDYKLEITVAPWGEGQLKINGQKFHRLRMPRIDARPFVGSPTPLSAT